MQKKIFLILSLVVISVCSFSQAPVDRSKSAVTAVDEHVKIGKSLSIPSPQDTSSIGGLDSVGLVIYARGLKMFFIRDTMPGGKKWTQVLKSGDIGSGVGITVTGNAVKIDTAGFRKVDSLYSVNDTTLAFKIYGHVYIVPVKGRAGSGGTVNNVATGFGLVGGPVTSSGTVRFDSSAGGGFHTQPYNDARYLRTIAGIAAGSDLTGTYPNPTIASNKVTFSKLQTLSPHTVFGNPTGSTANSKALYLKYGLRFDNDTLKIDTAILKSVFDSSGGGGATNLDSIRAANSFTINSSTGTAAQILAADTTAGLAGAMTVTDRRKSQRTEVSLSYAEMRLLTAPSTGVFYNTKINNIFAQFYWDPTNTATDDSVMIIKLAGITTGRLMRYYTDYILANWWPIKGDGVTDDSYYWNKAIKFTSSSLSHATKLKCLGLTYIVKNLIIYKDDNGDGQYDFVTITIEGPAATVDVSQALGSIAIFKTTDPSAFTLGVQLGRNCFIKNITFTGPAPSVGNPANTITWTDAQWLSGGIRNNTNSPNAAIVIDPFFYTVTSGNQYPGLSAFYTNTSGSGTSEFELDGCSIRNYAVGVMVSPAPTSNADNIIFRNGSQYSNRSFWASGQSQSRDNQIINLYSLGGVKYMVNCNEYGLNQGTPPQINNSSFAGSVKYLYQFNGQFGGMTISNTAMESVFSFGVSGGMPVNINNCQIYISRPEVEGTFVSPVLAQGSTINFRGGSLEWLDGVGVGAFTFIEDQVNFNGTLVRGGAPILQAYKAGNVTLEGVNYITNGFSSNIWESNHLFETSETVLRSTGTIPGMTYRTQNGVDQLGKFNYSMVGNKFDLIQLETKQINIDSTTFSGYFTTTTPALYQLSDLLESGPIDDTTDIYSPAASAVGFISDIRSDTVFLRNIPYGLQEGVSYPLTVFRIARFQGRVIGDLTNASDTIRNVRVSDGGVFAVNDKIKGAGIPTNTYVTYVDLAGGKMKISRPATATTTNVELYDAPLFMYSVGGYTGVYFKGDEIRNNGTSSTINKLVCTYPGVAGVDAIFDTLFYGGGGGSGSQNLASVTAVGNTTTTQLQVGSGSFAAPVSLNEVKFFGQSDVGSQINTPGYFNSTLASAGTNLVVSNSTAGWYNNFVSVGVRGSSYPNNDYLTGSNTGLALVLAQGSDVTRFALGTFNNVPLQLFSNNLERLTVFGNGNVGIGSTTDGSNGILQVTGRSRFTDTGSLAARFSYGSNIHSTFTQYSLIDKAYADSAYGAGGGSSDSLKVTFLGTGLRPFAISADTLKGKTLLADNGLTGSVNSDSTNHFVLGGALNQNTTLDGLDTYSFIVGTSSIGHRMTDIQLRSNAGVTIASSGSSNEILLAGNINATGGIRDGAMSELSGTQTLNTDNAWYAYTGTGADTWTLPDRATSLRRVYHIKNAGSGSLTVQRAGSDNIYDTSSVTSISISAGAFVTLYAGQTYWYKL